MVSRHVIHRTEKIREFQPPIPLDSQHALSVQCMAVKDKTHGRLPAPQPLPPAAPAAVGRLAGERTGRATPGGAARSCKVNLRHHPGPPAGRHAPGHGQGRPLPVPPDRRQLDPLHGAGHRRPPGHDLQAPPEGRREVRSAPESAGARRRSPGRTGGRALVLRGDEREDQGTQEATRTRSWATPTPSWGSSGAPSWRSPSTWDTAPRRTPPASWRSSRAPRRAGSSSQWTVSRDILARSSSTLAVGWTSASSSSPTARKRWMQSAGILRRA